MEHDIGREKSLRQYKLTRLAVILSVVFWFLEALMHVLIWEDTELFVEVFTPPGHEIWMRFTIISLFIAFGFYGDRLILARRMAEDAANLANIELTQIVETAADGMRIVDKDFNILRANQTFIDMTGVDREAVIGMKCHEVFRGHRCDTPDCPLVRISMGDERVEYDSEKETPDGKIIPCIVTATPFRRPDGTFVGIVEDFKDISERIESEKEIMDSREQLRDLTIHLQLVREEERSRIEREIHDELGQSLTVLNMDVYWLRKHCSKDDPAVVEKTTAMSELISNTTDSVKRICQELRPRLLDDFGLSAAIEWLAEDFSQRTSIPCRITSNPAEIMLQEELSIAVYRVFQEALTNIIRHSGATRVTVELRNQSGLFDMCIRDNGKGITSEMSNKHSFGLIGIKERVHGFGGEVGIQTGSSGTTLTVKIPVEVAETKQINSPNIL